jgi:protein-L-isoaspartate(D-aspartate) O-methyltransferase
MEELVRYLVERGTIKTKGIIDAFLRVDRVDFVLPGDRKNAYIDQPLSIGFGQTISQPTTAALTLEWLRPKRGDTILDVGSGSGWTTALLAAVVGEEGKVWGVDTIPELTAFGRQNLAKYHFPWAEIVQAHDTLGLQEYAPFDKILVSAAAAMVPPELSRQLKTGGSMVIPVKDAVWYVRKLSPKKFDIKKFEGFAFVPLI